MDPGEVISVTLKREFSEEALNSLEASAAEKKQIENAIETLFEKGNEVRFFCCHDLTALASASQPVG